MFSRKRRGTLAQELGKTIGGVASFAGMFAFCKASMQPPMHLSTREVGIYRSAYFAGSGDLFAPFPVDQITTLRWIGIALVIAGTLLRLKSYWRITAPKEEGQ